MTEPSWMPLTLALGPKVVNDSFREACREVTDLRVVGEACDVAQLRELVGAKRSGILLAGFTMVRQLSEEHARWEPSKGGTVVIVSDHQLRDEVVKHLPPDTHGVVFSSEGIDSIFQVLRLAARGLAVFPAGDSPVWRNPFSGPVQQETRRLTPRERDVLRAVAQGLIDKETSTALGISRRTILTHLERARRKLGARNRIHAVALVASQEPMASELREGESPAFGLRLLASPDVQLAGTGPLTMSGEKKGGQVPPLSLVASSTFFRQSLRGALVRSGAFPVIKEWASLEELAEDHDHLEGLALIVADRHLIRELPERRFPVSLGLIILIGGSTLDAGALWHPNARAILPTSLTIENVVSAMSLVTRGMIVAPGGLPRQFLIDRPFVDIPLSSREIEVLRLLAGGLTLREVSIRVAIAERTTQDHVGHIMIRMGASNRAHAVAMAASRGWFSLV